MFIFLPAFDAMIATHFLYYFADCAPSWRLREWSAPQPEGRRQQDSLDNEDQYGGEECGEPRVPAFPPIFSGQTHSMSHVKCIYENISKVVSIILCIFRLCPGVRRGGI